MVGRGHLCSPKGENRIARASALGTTPKTRSPWKGENRTAQGFSPGNDTQDEIRPERAAECRALFPKISFVKSDSMAFEKLAKLFLIRIFAMMPGLVANVTSNSLYVRLAH